MAVQQPHPEGEGEGEGETLDGQQEIATAFDDDRTRQATETFAGENEFTQSENGFQERNQPATFQYQVEGQGYSPQIYEDTTPTAMPLQERSFPPPETFEGQQQQYQQQQRTEPYDVGGLTTQQGAWGDASTYTNAEEDYLQPVPDYDTTFPEHYTSVPNTEAAIEVAYNDPDINPHSEMTLEQPGYSSFPLKAEFETDQQRQEEKEFEEEEEEEEASLANGGATTTADACLDRTSSEVYRQPSLDIYLNDGSQDSVPQSLGREKSVDTEKLIDRVMCLEREVRSLTVRNEDLAREKEMIQNKNKNEPSSNGTSNSTSPSHFGDTTPSFEKELRKITETGSAESYSLTNDPFICRGVMKVSAARKEKK